ncbi:hypothetical protein THAOC_05873, partial [Thalassiosira oceanica]
MVATILSSRQLPSPLAITELPLLQALVGNAALVSPSSSEGSSDSSDLSDIAPDDGHDDRGSKSSEVGVESDEDTATLEPAGQQLPLLTPSHLEASPSKPAAAAVVTKTHEKKTGDAGEVIKTSNDDADTVWAVNVDDADREKTRQLLAELAEKDRIIEECNMAKERLQADKSHLEDYTRRTMRKLNGKYQEALTNCKQDLQDANERIREMERREASERAARNRDEVQRWQNLSDKKDQELQEMMDRKDDEIDNLRRELRDLNEELNDSAKQRDEEIDAANESATLLLRTNMELEENLEHLKHSLECTEKKLSVKTEHANGLALQNRRLQAENKTLARSNRALLEGSRDAQTKMNQQARQSRKEIEKLQLELQDHRREMRERRKEWDLADRQLATSRQELEQVDRRYAKLSADKENLQEKYRKLKKTHRDAESARESKSSPSLCVVCHDNSSRTDELSNLPGAGPEHIEGLPMIVDTTTLSERHHQSHPGHPGMMDVLDPGPRSPRPQPGPPQQGGYHN